MQGPYAHAAEPETTQQFSNRAFMQNDAISLFDFLLNIDAPPAHKIAFRFLGYQRCNLFFLLRRQGPFRPPLGAITQTLDPFFVIAMHPVA